MGGGGDNIRERLKGLLISLPGKIGSGRKSWVLDVILLVLGGGRMGAGGDGDDDRSRFWLKWSASKEDRGRKGEDEELSVDNNVESRDDGELLKCSMAADAGRGCCCCRCCNVALMPQLHADNGRGDRGAFLKQSKSWFLRAL